MNCLRKYLLIGLMVYFAGCTLITADTCANEILYLGKVGTTKTLKATLDISAETAALVDLEEQESITGTVIQSQMVYQFKPHITYKKAVLYPVIFATITDYYDSEGNKTEDDTEEETIIQYFKRTEDGLFLVGEQKNIKRINKPKLYKNPRLVLPTMPAIGRQWNQALRKNFTDFSFQIRIGMVHFFEACCTAR